MDGKSSGPSGKERRERNIAYGLILSLYPRLFPVVLDDGLHVLYHIRLLLETKGWQARNGRKPWLPIFNCSFYASCTCHVTLRYALFLSFFSIFSILPGMGWIYMNVPGE